MEQQRQWPIMEQYHVWLCHLVSRVCFITETPRCEKRKISTATSEEIDDKKGKVSLPVWEFLGFCQNMVRPMLSANYARPSSPPRLVIQPTCFTTLAALTLWSTAVSVNNGQLHLSTDHFYQLSTSVLLYFIPCLKNAADIKRKVSIL